RALVVDEDLALAVAGRAFRPVVLELDRTDDGTAVRVDGNHGADRTTVVGKNDAVGEIVVHDAVETTGRHRDPFDEGEGREIEHLDGRIAGARNESMARLGRERN